VAAPSKDFLENSRRSVYILGRIDQQQVYRVTPNIQRLRAESNDPITVYIDSFGGETFFAEQIRSLLHASDQDSQTCRIITVVTNVAGSASADLLALGDYAIAYKNSFVLYHGTRQASQDALTTEKAESLAKSLKQTNEQFALRLARRAFRRCVFNYNNLAGQFEAVRKESSAEGHAPKSDLECFAYLLYKRLSHEVRNLPSEAFQLQLSIAQLNHYIFQERTFKVGEAEKVAQMEVQVLKLILDYELNRERDYEWSLSRGGLFEVERDFNVFIDYFLGEYRGHLEALIPELGDLFLDDKELAEWKGLKEKPDTEKVEWLKTKVESKMHPLWYFVVSLFRLLQQGEFTLTPRDAYWLGIVDEVIGASDLPCPRLVLESQLIPVAKNEGDV
jgi:ATP-dependent protease ClpP protease subunit